MKWTGVGGDDPAGETDQGRKLSRTPRLWGPLGTPSSKLQDLVASFVVFGSGGDQHPMPSMSEGTGELSISASGPLLESAKSTHKRVQEGGSWPDRSKDGS